MEVFFSPNFAYYDWVVSEFKSKANRINNQIGGVHTNH